jgi:hypothetical protein
VVITRKRETVKARFLNWIGFRSLNENRQVGLKSRKNGPTGIHFLINEEY